MGFHCEALEIRRVMADRGSRRACIILTAHACDVSKPVCVSVGSIAEYKKQICIKFGVMDTALKDDY